MVKIKIFSPGKTKEPWLQEAIQEYIKRLKPVAEIEWIHPKKESDLAPLVEKEKRWIALDPRGKEFTSEQFSKFIFQELESHGATINFVIGGAEGLPERLRKEPLISLSQMTFTHQATRWILLEQIYRAFEIEKGSTYHK
jgi:23S rRNA (pseudouridine1915-N3)-methyltransferase